jgi:hypothetical protein
MQAAQSPRDIADKPEVKALVQQASDMLASAEAFVIRTAGDYRLAAETLKSVKGRQSELKALRETITRPMLAALEAARALFRKPEQTLADAEQLLKQSMSHYDEEQERQRAEAQRKLDEAAERERRRLAQQAERAAAKGDADKAAELQERAAMVVAPIAQEERPAVAGVSRRETWHAEVTDLRALVRAVADGVVPLSAIEANKKFLNGAARALRNELRYPGVRAVPERTIASSGSA